MKENKGITLIALVITIIVLLILAGVSIAMLSGENSILNKASESSVQNAIGAAKDKCTLIAASTVADYYDDIYVQGNSTAYDSGTLDGLIATALKADGAIDVDGITINATPTSVKLTYTDGSSAEGTLSNGKITWTTLDIK